MAPSDLWLLPKMKVHIHFQRIESGKSKRDTTVAKQAVIEQPDTCSDVMYFGYEKCKSV